jgi:putative hydrolase of the HAD superfamily
MRAVVFDFGNVVGFFDHGRALTRLRTHTDLSEAELRAAIFSGTLEDDYESGRITSAAFLEHVIHLCRFRCSAEVLAAAYADIFWPNDDVCTLLPQLRGRYTLLLGSNTCEIHATQFKRQFAEAMGHFDRLVLSYEIGARKPRPEFFRHAQQLAGCAATQCLFIDDLPANVDGAQACGWNGIVYRRGDDLRSRLKDFGIAL